MQTIVSSIFFILVFVLFVSWITIPFTLMEIEKTVKEIKEFIGK